jgi:serine phosphatase RsbU (regulator of sigma subunit)
MRYSAIFFFIFLLTGHFQSLFSQPFHIEESKLGQYLGKEIYFANDDKGEDFEFMSKNEEINFSKGENEIPNFQITSAYIWSEIVLTSSLRERLYFHCNYVHFNEITFWIKGNREGLTSESFNIASERDKLLYNLHTYAVPLDFEKNDTITVYVRSQTSTVHILPFSVNRAKPLIIEQQHTDLLYGIFFGIFLITFFYNLFLYSATRSRAYLAYSAYIFFLGFYASGYKGYAARFLFEGNSSIAIHSVIFSAGIAGISAGVFSYIFLGGKHMRLSSRILTAASVIIYTAGTFLSLFTEKLGVTVVQVAALFGSLVLPLTGYWSLRDGFKPARFFLTAWSVLIAFLIVFMMKEFNLLPLTFFTDNSLFIGAALEICFLSLALADKINFMKQKVLEEMAEKEKAKEETLKLVRQNEHIIKSQKDVLEKAVKMRTKKLDASIEELRQINEELRVTMEKLEEQSLVIEKKNRTITESIHYAGKIQNALLPNVNEMSNFFNQYFVWYLPRDIVSGDFYWFQGFENDKTFYVAAADCTGHGIPGSLMSMIGINALNQIVIEHGERDTGKILDELHRLITKILQQNNSNDVIRDGMDIALCKIDFAQKKVFFSGAMRPLYHFRHSTLTEYKGDKVPIAFNFEDRKNYTVVETSFENGDVIFLFSDGITDQFDANDRKKFGSKKLRELLEGNAADFENLQKTLENDFYAWKGATNQTDDVIFIGIKL